ncbi:hypothetical protein [Agromyces sp. GXS1127]|uniref:hypothetical protein n=1 Tax=Agromyces sp. GXS1127 TaxID=3424181 RepID=UPI003D31E502
MVYSPPRESTSLALAKQRQRDHHDVYHAALASLPAEQREAVARYVGAVRDEAAARRVEARDGRGGR